MPRWSSISLEELPAETNVPLVLHLRSHSDPIDGRIPGDTDQDIEDTPRRCFRFSPLDGPDDRLPGLAAFGPRTFRASSEDTFATAQSSFQRGCPSPLKLSSNDDKPSPGTNEPSSTAASQLLNLPISFQRQPHYRRCFSANAAIPARKRPSYPDRFIPDRLPSAASERPLNVTKHPSQLRLDEKFTRQRSRTANPFSPRSLLPKPASRTPQTTHNGPYSFHSPTALSDTFVLGSLPDPFAPGIQGRSTSAGAVWNVGGPTTLTTGPIAAVPNGRGGALGSGTNAPIYEAGFLEEMPGPKKHLDSHEARLALALDIDQASRILPISGTTTSNGRIHPSSNKKRAPTSPIGWRDNAWMQDGRSGREYSKNEPLTIYEYQDILTVSASFSQ
jgi:hypothetical protein